MRRTLWLFGVLGFALYACEHDSENAEGSGGNGAAGDFAVVAGGTAGNTASGGAQPAGGAGGEPFKTAGAPNSSAGSGAAPSAAGAGAPSSDHGGAGGCAGMHHEQAGAPPVPPPAPDIPSIDEDALPEPTAEVGFIELEQVSYGTPFDRLVDPTLPELRHSGGARMFYRFVPADNDAKNRPLFVFFNGGPGYTSMLLMSFGTGPLTLSVNDPDGAPAPNPNSFSALGSLLYVDSRDAGFSYLLSDQPTEQSERQKGLTGDSFHPALDAADFVRVILRLLDRQPALRNNPVVLVGESYGGTRAAVMLDYLLRPDLLEEGSDIYRDGTLREEINAHYAKVFVGIPEAEYTPELYAKQFGWQILIQPHVVGAFQSAAQRRLESAAIERMAQRAGISAAQLQSERCLDHRNELKSWCTDIDARLESVLPTPDGFERLMGVSPTEVPLLQASSRTGGFRTELPITLPAEPAEFVELLGSLPDYDRYYSNFVPQNVRGGAVTMSQVWAVPFLRAARFVNTMITNSFWDGNVITEAIVPGLNDIVPLMSQQKWFTGAEYVGEDPERPAEHFRLHYQTVEGLWTATERDVYFPSFEDSGHMVSVSEPAQLLQRARAFLAATGL